MSRSDRLIEWAIKGAKLKKERNWHFGFSLWNTFFLGLSASYSDFGFAAFFFAFLCFHVWQHTKYKALYAQHLKEAP